MSVSCDAASGSTSNNAPTDGNGDSNVPQPVTVMTSGDICTSTSDRPAEAISSLSAVSGDNRD